MNNSDMLITLCKIIASQEEELDKAAEEQLRIEMKDQLIETEITLLKEDLADIRSRFQSDLRIKTERNLFLEVEVNRLQERVSDLINEKENEKAKLNVSDIPLSNAKQAYTFLRECFPDERRFSGGFPLIYPGNDARYELVKEIATLTGWEFIDASQFLCDFLERKLDENGEKAFCGDSSAVPPTLP